MKHQFKIFGEELIMDLYDCKPEVLRSKKKILEYLNKICKLIKMKKYGKPIIKWFGKDFATGFSFVQLIETSSIVGHLSEAFNRAYINIFSCKIFNEKKALNFTKKFFQAKKIKKTILVR